MTGLPQPPGGAPQPTRTATPRRRKKASPAGAVIIISAVLVGGVGAAGAWYVRNRPSPVADESSVETLAANALGTAREAAVFFRESATRDIAAVAALIREASEDTDAEPEAETEVETAVMRPSTARAAAAPPPVMGPTVGELVAGAPGPALTTEVVATSELSTEAPLFMVFDETYPEVVPPGTDSIRMPSNSLGDMWISEVATPDTGLVEVVVGATGGVETAKLITSPQNVHESMLLSAVKAWQFSPARLDGQGVRYRQRIHVAVARRW